MTRLYKARSNRQQGAVALLVTVVLLVAITLIVIFSGKLTVLEHKISANDARAKMATARAEEGLNIALSKLKLTSPSDRINTWVWSDCTSAICGAGFNPLDGWDYAELSAADIGNNCDQSNEEGYCVRYLTTTPDKNYAALTLLSRGHVDNDESNQVVTQAVGKYNFFSANSGNIPPVMTPIPVVGGNMTIIPNPNASGFAGTSNAISIWSDEPMAFGGAGSMQTCGALYDGGGVESSGQCIEPGVDNSGGLAPTVTTFNQCNCSALDLAKTGSDVTTGAKKPYSTKDDFGADVVDDYEPFPDMFPYFFNTADWQSIKDISKVYASCDNTPEIDDDTNPGDIIWIEGDCTIGGPTFTDDQLGSRFVEDGKRGPVILVVEGDFKVTANNIHIWGIVYIVNQVGVSNTDSDVDLTGGPIIHGALLADNKLDFGGGSMTIMYDSDMFRAVTADENNPEDMPTDKWLPVSGSWSDVVEIP